MKDELVTVLEAVRRAQAELAAYLDSADRNAELTIAKLVGILERRGRRGRPAASALGSPHSLVDGCAGAGAKARQSELNGPRSARVTPLRAA
jgi:hypothetical protein